MARAQGHYSRMIAWLKILLPLVALGLLSTIFLFSRSVDPINQLPFSDSIQQAGETLTEMVAAPYYAGETENGDMLTMTARAARPLADGTVEADEPSARMQMTDGSEIRLNAAQATLLDDQHIVEMRGGVEITSSTGYVLTTQTLTSGTDRIEVESHGPVYGEGPLGELEAGKMRIVTIEDSEDVQMLFTGGVKLIYLPQTK